MSTPLSLNPPGVPTAGRFLPTAWTVPPAKFRLLPKNLPPT